MAQDSAAPLDAVSSAVHPDAPCAIAGIGVSSADLARCVALLQQVPADAGIAYLVARRKQVSDEQGALAALREAIRMPVAEATHGTELRANHVYVGPPGASLTIRGHTLEVGPLPATPGTPIDRLFRSIAENHGSAGIAVLLGGKGPDGVAGLCEVRAAGGITFAEDAADASRGNEAVMNAACCADYVLPLSSIAQRLGSVRPAALARNDAADDPAALADILEAVKTTTAVDFRGYRDTTLNRRIRRRAALHGAGSLAEYARMLHTDRGEADALYHDLLINVTRFFRDPELFEALRRDVFPRILAAKSPDAPIRVWVAGCSTGQEVYSLAIELLEFLESRNAPHGIQFFGTDLSEAVALATARAAAYPESIEEEISPERLRRYFHKEGAVYCVDRALRDRCVFALHNVASDPPFSHVDLISCRNVLIYMAPLLQRRVLHTFHYALNPTGFLVLGTSESVAGSGELFDQEDRAHKIFSKRPAARPYSFLRGGASLAASVVRVSTPTGTGDFIREAERALLGRFAPPAVLINERSEVLQFRGRTGLYLQAPAADPTPNLISLAREGLSVPLRETVEASIARGQVARRTGIRFESEGQTHLVDIEVVPLRVIGAAERTFLVVFEQPTALRSGNSASHHEVARDESGQAPASRRALSWLSRRRTPRSMPTVAEASDALREELDETKRYLHSFIEQHDATTEELRSANEEILSSNEELQSTNEELQTAKEELQSSNEELTTLNDQLQQRNAELIQANGDLSNVLGNIAMPVIIVGEDLRIRRLTPSASKVMGLMPTDIGRPLTALQIAIDAPDLENLVRDAIATTRNANHEVRDHAGRVYSLRIGPYRTADGRIDGAVLVLVDITELRRGEEARRRLGAIVESSDDAILSKTLDGVILSWNRGAEQLYGYTAREVIGMPVSVVIPPGHHDELPAILERLRRGEHIEHYETVRRRKDGQLVDVSVTVSPIRTESGEIVGASTIARDISTRKRVAETLRFQVESSAALATLTDSETMLQRVASVAVPYFADWAVVDVVDESGFLRRVAMSHRDPAKVKLLEELERRYPSPASANRGPQRVVRTGEPEMLEFVPEALLVASAKDAEHLKLLREIGPRSYICAPMRIRNETRGVITFLYAESGRRYNVSDLRVAEDLAYRAGVAIENAKLYTELKESDRRKDEFLALLSHELRNPLAPIRNAVEVLRSTGSTSHDMTSARDLIDRQLRQLTRIVDDLLDISRVTRGRIDLRMERVQLRAIVESAVESSRPLIDAAGHELSVSLPKDPVYIDADPTRLAQVLLNLLNNAAKFTPQNGHIWLTATVTPETPLRRTEVVIAIRDTGVGIPSEDLGRVFEMFTQADHSLERSHGGLGVGLTLARSLIRMHGGQLEAHSAGPGQGSEFVVRLPTSVRLSDDVPRVLSPVSATNARHHRILVVDDNRDQAESLGLLLQLLGHTVRTANDAPAALDIATAFQPNVALVDIGMPGMNGYDLARAMRERPELGDVVLVAQTGWGQDDHRARSHEAGFDYHLVKPIPIEKLQALLAGLH